MLVDKIPVFMGKMFENDILFLNDIVNWNGRVMSLMELSELYGKVCSRVQPIDYSISPEIEEAGGSGRR